MLQLSLRWCFLLYMAFRHTELVLASEAAERPCLIRYETESLDFMLVSRAQTSGFMATSIEVAKDALLRAEEQLWGCWAIGGRYWELSLDFVTYMERVGFELMGIQSLRTRPYGLCAPADCSIEQIIHLIVPRLLSFALQIPIPVLPPPQGKEIELHELDHWNSIELDFAIVGVNGCGTNSLQYNLGLNRDIGFTTNGTVEDFRFFSHDSVLPRKLDVDEFNFEVAKLHRRRPNILGLKHAALFESYRMMIALARKTEFKALLIVCDPTDRLEKWFYLRHLCDAEVAKLNMARCWKSISEAFDDPNGGYHSEFQLKALSQNPKTSDHPLHEGYRYGNVLTDLQELFGERLMVLHQESLRRNSKDMFARIARFLEARPFSEGVQFLRKNSHRGTRTSLHIRSTQQERSLPKYFITAETPRKLGI
eukprot:TRINITY_DN5822_c0_g1_i2.p1 TRINITY_DN5822_c0_g1~~TRINITY_DN5822_c0_g1_i2.p1  ORF type:complete len:423 (+),score=38.10 TRINITY_DN5822_c0_g1_i2:236-1504(+)